MCWRTPIMQEWSKRPAAIEAGKPTREGRAGKRRAAGSAEAVAVALLDDLVVATARLALHNERVNCMLSGISLRTILLSPGPCMSALQASGDVAQEDSSSEVCDPVIVFGKIITVLIGCETVAAYTKAALQQHATVAAYTKAALQQHVTAVRDPAELQGLILHARMALAFGHTQLKIQLQVQPSVATECRLVCRALILAGGTMKHDGPPRTPPAREVQRLLRSAGYESRRWRDMFTERIEQ